MPKLKAKGTSAHFSGNNKVKLIHSGKEYFSLLRLMIENAKECIHLQTYIFDADETGLQIAGALKDAAERGVKIYLLVDGYASQDLPGAFIKELKAAGINFRFFEPVFKSRHFYFGRRLHHKITVIDTIRALVGGINVADHYNDKKEAAAWLDFALYIEGVAPFDLGKLCWKTWQNFPKSEKEPLCVSKQQELNISQEETSLLRIRRNDWLRGKNQISYTYRELLRSAESHVIILSSYFIPGYAIRRSIRQAVKQGTKVSVIVTGISDVWLAKNAERFMYKWLLKHRVNVYEYSKNILHGKMATCDGRWMTIGSYNVNDISAKASIELNIDVKDYSFVKEVEHELMHIIENDCIKITEETRAKSATLLKQFINWFSYQFIRVVFYLFTFYVKPQK